MKVPPPPSGFQLPLVAAVLLTPEGAESPGSGRIGVIDRCVGFFLHLRPLGRAAAEGFSPTPPRAHWIGPELCGRGEESNRVMRTMQIGESPRDI